MKRAAILALALAAAGCMEPPKSNRAVVYVQDLPDINHWDRMYGAKGNDGFEAMLALEPIDSVPVLLGLLQDPTPTKIDDRLHRVPTVGDVAFHMLLIIFQMSATDFDDEGVWVGTDPINNPIYTVHLDTDVVRGKVRQRLFVIAKQKGWIPEK